ncbi:GIY-YIG nuclease family protein [Glaciibacter flavus]|uniref:GIY-YIG nuclease family protein n=1 Tax=Orlajensenia flava TaxID=2565934 RepID=UPI0026BB1336
MVALARCSQLRSDGVACGLPIEAGAPVQLCSSHLLAAHDWVARDVGVTDLLPGPCVACGGRVGIRYPSGWVCAVCEWRAGELVDVEIASELRIEVVYYLRYDDRIKIGTSATPRRRIAALPHDEVLAFERGGRGLEQRRHRQFADQRIPRTEWFEIDDTLLDHVSALRAGIEDPWDLYSRWLSTELALRG